MYIFIIILIILAAILLTLLVLVQNSKGGGLANGFASGNQVMGAPRTADFLEKATWTLIGIIVVLSIVATGFVKGNNAEEGANHPSVNTEYTLPQTNNQGQVPTGAGDANTTAGNAAPTTEGQGE